MEMARRFQALWVTTSILFTLLPFAVSSCIFSDAACSCSRVASGIPSSCTRLKSLYSDSTGICTTSGCNQGWKCDCLSGGRTCKRERCVQWIPSHGPDTSSGSYSGLGPSGLEKESFFCHSQESVCVVLDDEPEKKKAVPSIQP